MKLGRQRNPSSAVLTADGDLNGLIAYEQRLDGVRRADLSVGDRVLVYTRNSVYSLTRTSGGVFRIEGGWFDLQRAMPSSGAVDEVRVLGCTLGGSVLLTNIIAAPGLFLELDSGIRTTRIRKVLLLTAAAPGRLRAASAANVGNVEKRTEALPGRTR